MSGTVPDRGQYWSYRQEGNVGIWEIHDWGELFDGELPEAEEHYGKITGSGEITASIIQFDSVDALGSQMQDHITDAWSQLSQSASAIERTAYVADGITGMAVKSKVTAPNTELESFESVDEAIQWASN